MDAVVSSAVEEICSQGLKGLTLRNLWSMLEPSLSDSGLDLSNGVKAALWTQLLRVPSLQFEAAKVTYDAKDPSIQSFEDAERLNVRVVAKEQLRDNFVGLYHVRSAGSNMSAHQRGVLERLAIARKNGVTQNQLAKEFGMEGRNFFYVVKSLECQGLIARQSAVVRTKESSNTWELKNNPIVSTNLKNSPIVSTNLMCLHRYAKHLGCQQKFWITVEENNDEQLVDPVESADVEDGLPLNRIKEDVLVKDYLPKLKAICDKLEAAKGKVLVVSDIKKDLGYTGSSGHRAWREVCSRLQRARIIEVFDAKVNNKFDSCLRLLKNFSPKCFETSTPGEDDSSGYKHRMKFGRKCQVTEQLTELAIEHQIYDMIDAAGFEGITVVEVCKRLGIDHKKNYGRLVNMFTRFGMLLQSETHNKCNIYRVWTRGNFKPGYNNKRFNKSKDAHNEIGNCNNLIFNVTDSKRLVQTTSLYGCTKSEDTDWKVDNASRRTTEDEKMNTEVSDRLHADDEADLRVISLPQESVFQPTISIPDVELSSVTVNETNSKTTISPSAMLRPSISASHQKYPCLPLTVGSARREQRILERLQDEKFILRGELFRWIIKHETDKSTATDRRTIFRSINKLQSEGHCKCIDINVPVLTNCGRTRITQVILHPSIETLSPQLLGEIHDKLRLFEVQSRGHHVKKVKRKTLLPVIESIQRTHHYMDSDIAAIRSEAMRSNGFVQAKMIRAKLLHNFLWDYLNCSDGSDGTSSSEVFVHDLKNPHTSYQPFLLEDAIKSIPIELFLQVVGSTKKLDDMMEKCKRGSSLADLAREEYVHLMDSNATGRLSVLIDILRRLKLVRFVAASPGNVSDCRHATLKHALELKPYVEEPLSTDATSRTLMTRSLDFRPRIRHDFTLSSRQAVNEYWQTLEYCYATADPRSALLAFPGSAVREVFLFRSWASVRVMTAEQRAALRELVARRDLNTKLSYKECEKIANDLNLTLEQVLRVYYDRRKERLNSFDEGTSKKSRQKIKRKSSRRKKLPKERPGKRARHDVVGKQLDETRVTTFPETSILSIDKDKELAADSGEQDIPLQEIFEDGDHLETVEEYGSKEEGEASMEQPTRQRRFIWTDETDRQLIMQYVRYRAARGAKFSRTNWCSISYLPAPPGTCRKRMAWLNGSLRFRKLVMRLCNILGKRYVKYLEKSKNAWVDQDDPKLILTSSEGKDLNRNSGDSEHYDEMDPQEEQWDDFNDKDVKMALDEVLHYKKMTILENSKRVGSVYGDFLDTNESEFTSATPLSTDMGGVQCKFSRGRSKGRSLHRRLKKILNGRHVSKEVFESLAVSNAVELFKLVFLNTSTSLEVPTLLAENLRRYSEHDLFSAFSHLREKKIMIGGNNNEPFVLSQIFLHSISKSPFPANTGEIASKFSKFLNERDKDLVEDGITIPSDLQCGDIFHLFALVSSGELCISSCLPNDGVGEPEDLRSAKRKVDSCEPLVDTPVKKLKFAPAAEGEIISRREKGFPGIMVSVCRTSILRTDAMELSDSWNCIDDQYFGGSDRLSVAPTHKNISFDYMESLYDTDGVVSLPGNHCESTWHAMTAFADHLMSVGRDQEEVSVISPEAFRLVYSAIQLAGDQGLSIEEISQVANLQGEKLPQLIIDVLQTFQRVLKVNSFDNIRIVDVLYCSKYFLASTAGSNRNRVTPSVVVLGKSDDQLVSHPENYDIGGKNLESQISDGAKSENEKIMIVGEVHKVTVLNLPPEVDDSIEESKISSMNQRNPKEKLILNTVGNESGSSCPSSGGSSFPILPWFNGDGTTNKMVYKGLRRRILGIVMQNPGILEVDVIQRMKVLNPQSCKRLLELMALDKHLIVKKMYQKTFSGPPGILGTLLNRSYKQPKFVCRDHYFANPMSTSLL